MMPGHESIDDIEIRNEIAKSGIWLSFENAIKIDQAIHSLYDDLDRSMARTVKTRGMIYRVASLQIYKFLLTLDRMDCRNMVVMLTDHNLIAATECRMGLSDHFI